MKNYVGSTVPVEIMKRMNEKQFGWNDELSQDSFRALFMSMAIYLSEHKSKDKVVAVKLEDWNNKFHFGAFVQFLEQTEAGADDGSWSISFTFDETEIDEKNWEVHSFSDPDVETMFEDTIYSNSGVAFKFRSRDNKNQICEAAAQSILCMLIDCVRDYMIANVVIDPDLEFTDLMNFRAEASGESVYISCVPGMLVKQLIKNDSSIGTVGSEDHVAAAAAYIMQNRGMVRSINWDAVETVPRKFVPSEMDTACIDLFQDYNGRICRLVTIVA